MTAKMQQLGYEEFLSWQLQDPGTAPIDDSRLFDPDDAPSGFPGGLGWQDNKEVAHAWRLADPYTIALDVAYPDPLNGTFTYAPPNGVKMWFHGPHAMMLGAEFGQHQLRWVMTDFLQNVHNTLLTQDHAYLMWTPFVRDVIYANALGSYKDLVLASGKGASMLYYLGQPDSNKLVPNENYGRELAELHTVGVKSYTIGSNVLNTYTETDIAEFARILTGWDMVDWGAFSGIQPPGPNWGDFIFTQSEHDTLQKTVSMTGSNYGPKNYPGPLGPNLQEGEELIADLVAHPLCALHISRRLVQWFLGDDFEGQFQGPWLRTAVAFLNTGGDLKAAVRELFNYTFIDEICPPGTRDNKVRRPLNKVMAFKRALSATIAYNAPDSYQWFIQQYQMGQVSGWWPAPNGYQPENPKWTATVQPMVRFYYDAIWGGTGYVDPSTGQAVPGNGFRIPSTTLADALPTGTPVSDYAARAAEYLMGGCLPPLEEAEIQDILLSTTLLGDKRRWALFFVLTSPAYQFLC